MASSCTTAASSTPRPTIGRSLDKPTYSTNSRQEKRALYTRFEHELTTFRYEEVRNKRLSKAAVPGACKLESPSPSRWANWRIYYPYNLVQIVHVPDTPTTKVSRAMFLLLFLLIVSQIVGQQDVLVVEVFDPSHDRISSVALIFLWLNFYEGHRHGILT